METKQTMIRRKITEMLTEGPKTWQEIYAVIAPLVPAGMAYRETQRRRQRTEVGRRLGWTEEDDIRSGRKVLVRRYLDAGLHRGQYKLEGDVFALQQLTEKPKKFVSQNPKKSVSQRSSPWRQEVIKLLSDGPRHLDDVVALASRQVPPAAALARMISARRTKGTQRRPGRTAEDDIISGSRMVVRDSIRFGIESGIFTRVGKTLFLTRPEDD